MAQDLQKLIKIDDPILRLSDYPEVSKFLNLPGNKKLQQFLDHSPAKNMYAREMIQIYQSNNQIFKILKSISHEILSSYQNSDDQLDYIVLIIEISNYPDISTHLTLNHDYNMILIFFYKINPEILKVSDDLYQLYNDDPENFGDIDKIGEMNMQSLNVLINKSQENKTKKLAFDVKFFQKSLKDLFSDQYETFNQAIIYTESIIAGGAVLSAYADFKLHDLDLYIHTSQAKKMSKLLTDMGFGFNNGHIASRYDKSFFRKNNILARFTLLNDEPDVKIDLMLIPDAIPLEQVVQNFDLNFCQIYYDGRQVIVYHPESIRSKHGVLTQEYTNKLLDSNIFTLKRIEKYRNRGFRIDISILPIKVYDNTEVNAEAWVARYIYEILYNFYVYSDVNSMNDRFNFVCQNPLTVSTIEEINQIIDRIKPDPRDFLYKIILKEILRWHDSDTKNKYINMIRYFMKIPESYLINLRPSKYESMSCFITDYDYEHIADTDPISEHMKNDNHEKCKKKHRQRGGSKLKTLQKTESDLPTTCKDLIMFTEEELSEYIRANRDNYLFIFNDQIFCYSYDLLHQFLTDQGNWFYECKEHISKIEPRTYVKLPMSIDGNNVFVPFRTIIRLLKSMHNVVHVVPYLDESGEQLYLPLTISFENAYTNHPNYVSANHCQDGSAILIYDFQICQSDKEDMCLLTKKFKADEKELDPVDPDEKIIRSYNPASNMISRYVSNRLDDSLINV